MERHAGVAAAAAAARPACASGADRPPIPKTVPEVVSRKGGREGSVAARTYINGYDAIVLLPESRKADMTLTGFPNPF